MDAVLVVIVVYPLTIGRLQGIIASNALIHSAIRSDSGPRVAHIRKLLWGAAGLQESVF
ncbi:hypothetical protein LCGC14_2805760 [marine sediment metagenome]|uniref:Uncharacterized protein n=1 Tax=marine sediment metagenome TaxID=412755 RepID=A0A0F9BCP7_9ZZZZ